MKKDVYVLTSMCQTDGEGLSYWSGRTQGLCRPGMQEAGSVSGESCRSSSQAAERSAVRIPMIQESVVVLDSTFIGAVTG